MEITKDTIKQKKIVVYFLKQQNEIVYVGKSSQLQIRLENHKKNKCFDQVIYFNIAEEDIDLIENNLIERLLPKYNKIFSTRYHISDDILEVILRFYGVEL